MDEKSLQVDSIKRSNISFEELVRLTRLRMLRMHYEAGVGHIGGNLSSLDCMLFLHHYVMKSDDLFVLSKGHAAGALYITLWSLGIMSDSELQTFHGDNSVLPGHPAPSVHPDIKIATGSLGHGFPVAAGMALSRKINKIPGTIFCLCSDGEWQEGSNWEALIFASHHQLDNLVLLVDVNGLQGFGSTDSVASLGNMRPHFEQFGLKVVDLNGHEESELKLLRGQGSGERVVFLLNTVKGKGVSFMEDKLEWHYLPLTKEQYEKAIREQGI